MYCKDAQQMILPYIQRKLNDKELEKFIDHIRECPECHEELEIYFTIYFALERLDEGGQLSYNIQKLLVDDLKNSEHRIRRRKLARFYRLSFIVLAQVVLAMVLMTQVQMWDEGGKIEETTIYKAVYGEQGSNTEELQTKSSESISEDKEENTKKDSKKKKKKSKNKNKTIITKENKEEKKIREPN